MSANTEPEPATATSAGTSKESTSQDEMTEKTEARKKAIELLAQGKRNMVCGEIPKAVTLYEEAVKILVDNCGELSYDCAEAYFSCGSALLELGRLENSVLGAALEGVDVEEEKEEAPTEQFEKPPEDNEEREKLRKEVYEAMSDGDRKEPSEKSKSMSDGDSKEPSEKSKSNPEENDATAPKEDDDKNTVAKNEENRSSMETNQADETEKGDGNSTVNNQSKSETLQMQNSSDEVKNEKNEAEKKSEVDENTIKNIENKNLENKKENSAQVQDCLKDIINTVSMEPKDKTELDEAGDKGSGEKAVASPKKDNVAKEEENASKEEEKSPENLVDSKEQSKGDEATDSKEVSKSNDGKTEKENEDGEAEEMDVDKNGADGDEGEAVDTAEDEDGDDSDEATGEGSQEDTEKGGDDVGNFQLAWEHLDLAKVIYLKSDSKEDQLKAAECHLKLGELSMETELHEQASEDLLAALKIQEKYLDKDDRIIAETHYTLGLAFGLGKDFDKSISHYQQAVSVIEARIASLMKLVEEKEVNAENKENQADDPLMKYKNEIKDLQDLIPEMQNKIEDAKVEQKDMAQMMEMAKAALGLNRPSTTGFTSTLTKTDPGASLSGSSSQTMDENGVKKASDIAHLVRRKRKQDDEENAPADVDSKKICSEDKGDNGATSEEKKEEIVNGHADKPEDKSVPSTEPMAS